MVLKLDLFTSQILAEYFEKFRNKGIFSIFFLSKRKFEEVDSDSDEAWKRTWKRQDKVGNTGKTYFAKWRYQLDKSCTVEEEEEVKDENKC